MHTAKPTPGQSRFTSSGRAARLILAIAFFLSLIHAAHGQTVTTLYNFTSGDSGSGNPQAVALVQGRDAELFGTSYSLPYGSIFKLSTSKVYTELFEFSFTDGNGPAQGLSLASDGSFYGTTLGGGIDQNGVLFRITPTATYTAIHIFSAGADGYHPAAPPIQASDGNLYGATLSGTVYKYKPGGSLSTIYQFTGMGIIAAFMQASDGFLYGTSADGGSANCGTIFNMTVAGVLLHSYSFPCNGGGSSPGIGPLVQAADGNFYGTTGSGGVQNQGTIYKMTPDFQISTLYTFMGRIGGLNDGRFPNAGLVQATDGYLYGTTDSGGANGIGTLYRISTSGDYQLLYSFTNATGIKPAGSLMQHTNGRLYGTAMVGGTNRGGTVFQLDMGLGPFIKMVRPTARVGQTVEILGQALTGATSVTFNGVPATSFKVSSSTFMTAVVPTGVTTGPVVVTTPNVTLTGNVNFVVSH